MGCSSSKPENDRDVVNAGSGLNADAADEVSRETVSVSYWTAVY